jgi:hypothetical protein
MLGGMPVRRMLHLEVPIDGDDDRKVMADALTSARAAELVKAHYVTRRAARDGGRRVPASELAVPEPAKRRLALLDRLAKALAEARETSETG